MQNILIHEGYFFIDTEKNQKVFFLIESMYNSSVIMTSLIPLDHYDTDT